MGPKLAIVTVRLPEKGALTTTDSISPKVRLVGTPSPSPRCYVTTGKMRPAPNRRMFLISLKYHPTSRAEDMFHTLLCCRPCTNTHRYVAECSSWWPHTNRPPRKYRRDS